MEAREGAIATTDVEGVAPDNPPRPRRHAVRTHCQLYVGPRARARRARPTCAQLRVSRARTLQTPLPTSSPPPSPDPRPPPSHSSTHPRHPPSTAHPGKPPLRSVASQSTPTPMGAIIMVVRVDLGGPRWPAPPPVAVCRRLAHPASGGSATRRRRHRQGRRHGRHSHWTLAAAAAAVEASLPAALAEVASPPPPPHPSANKTLCVVLHAHTPPPTSTVTASTAAAAVAVAGRSRHSRRGWGAGVAETALAAPLRPGVRRRDCYALLGRGGGDSLCRGVCSAVQSACTM